jgi:hypothetical protein
MQHPSPSNLPSLTITQGACRALFAFDIGHAIDLDATQKRSQRLTATLVQRETLRSSASSRRLPLDFAQQPPLRITRSARAMQIGEWCTTPSVEAAVYDFGAVSMTYTIPLSGRFEHLVRLGDMLYDNATLRDDARRRAADLLAVLDDAITNPRLSACIEDYLIYEIEKFEIADGTLQQWMEQSRSLLAGVLRSESGPLSTQESDDALARCLSYSPSDAALVDWNSAVIIDERASESSGILEFANVELLEMRHLDNLLDASLDRAYRAAERRSRFAWLDARRAGADMHDISRLQIEHAALFEGVNNSLKLVGDQHLARLYHAAAARFHLPEWDASILRKLGTIESIYSKLSDRAAGRRAEALEIIIIVLILFEIVMGLMRVW